MNLVQFLAIASGSWLLGWFMRAFVDRRGRKPGIIQAEPFNKSFRILIDEINLKSTNKGTPLYIFLEGTPFIQSQVTESIDHATSLVRGIK